MRLRIYPISTSRTPSRLFWFRTISIPTKRRHCMKPSRPLRRGGSSSVSSWLDLAESELGVLSSQCLDRRIPDKQTLVEEVAAWEHERNRHHTKADWHFTTENARIKLKHLYPLL